MVKITTSPPGFLGMTTEPLIDVSNYKGLTNVPEDVSSNIYLHGDIQSRAGYDIPIFLEGEFFGEGVHDVFVLLPSEEKEGEVDEVPCKMYVWKVNYLGRVMYKGYIITPECESREFVEKQFKNKEKHI